MSLLFSEIVHTFRRDLLDSQSRRGTNLSVRDSSVFHFGIWPLIIYYNSATYGAVKSETF